MHRITNDESANTYATTLIRIKARQICRRPGFTYGDRKDIEQELLTDLVERLSNYDSSKSKLNTFIARVVDHKVVSLLRHYEAAKRSRGREECSLNTPVRDADGHIVDLHQTRSIAIDVPQRLRDLERDLAEVLNRLPEDLRLIARGLVTDSLSALAAELGISRTALRTRIEKLREHLEDAGLREYL